MNNIDTSIFKAYDIRGIYPTQINADVVYKTVQAYVKFLTESSGAKLQGSKIVLGHDMRLSGEEFSETATRAFTDAGVNVIDVGLVSTDQIYFAAATLPVRGGIQITASHNPKEFGGMKMVREKGAPISGDSGIYQIRDLVVNNLWEATSEKKGTVEKLDITQDYFDHVLKNFNVGKIKPFKIVANANFGMANPAIAKLKNILPVEFVEVIDGHIDGNFPKGPSDPLLPSNRNETIAAIKQLKPDLGVAWDGDADRCFFFDEHGEFVTPAYASALFAKFYLAKNPGAKILHDTRVVRVIESVVEKSGGVSIMTKAGHSFIKERMMKEDAVFGCETSGHYYFKDNFYLDNGLIPFLAMLEIISQDGRAFSEILKPLRQEFYISEEINFEVANTNILEDLKQQYGDAEIGSVDGYDFNYPTWRVNVRKSNTQNLLRINLEANSAELLNSKTQEVSNFILANKLAK